MTDTPDTNHCGSCTACCRIYAIPEFDKPAGKWCTHCNVGKSCKIYQTRPQRCADFKCLWLQSQSEVVRLDAKLRPDKCKVVFAPTTNDHIIAATTMPGAPLAWQNKNVAALINRFRKAGIAVAVGSPESPTQLLLGPDGTQKRVRMTTPDKDGMQWSEEEV